MILYVNGDSHSAGAEAVNDFCFAEDDSLYWSLGRRPHPDKEAVSYGCNLANELGAIFHCDAESASSNSRIIRTTREYLQEFQPDAIIIGWSTWERQEWLYDEIYWQVNAGGVGHDWPDPIKEKYKDYIINLNWIESEITVHEDIWNFHIELKESQIPHLFFNTYSFFSHTPKYNWEDSYIDPYNQNSTYWNWLTNKGFRSRPTYHFGPDAHRKWAEFLLPHLTRLL